MTSNKHMTRFYKITILCIAAWCLSTASLVAQTTQMTYEQTRIISGGYDLPEYTSESSDSLLNAYIEVAYRESDALRAAYHGWLASQSKGDQVGTLPDPEIMFSYFLNPAKYDGVLSQASLGVQQMFPWFGTLSEERNFVTLLSHARWQQLESIRLDLYRSVKEAWFSLVYIHRRKAYLQEHLEWVTRLERLTRSRLETGYASRSDMLQLEMERIEIRSLLDALEISYRGELARFNSLLNRKTDSDVQLPEGRPELIWDLTYDRTSRLTTLYFPEVTEKEIMVQAGHSMEKLAKLRKYPMIGVGLEVMGPNSSPMMGGSRLPVYANFAVRIPLWKSRNKAIMDEAVAERKSAEYDKQALMRDLQAEVAMVFSEYEEADIMVKSYTESLLPRSRELTDLLLLDYSNGRVRIDEVITARRRSVDFATRLEQAIYDRNMSVVALERLTTRISIEN